MVCMLVVPSPAARTCVRNIIPMASAMTAMTPTMTTNVRLPPDRSTAFPPPDSAAKMLPDIRPPQVGLWPVTMRRTAVADSRGGGGVGGRAFLSKPLGGGAYLRVGPAPKGGGGPFRQAPRPPQAAPRVHRGGHS